jgi:tRNA nucleotidyltransferase (CCA-adding enzyme)
MTETLRPPEAVGWITRRLEEAGFETWAVGGAVRDALVGEPGGDWDLASRARPDQVQSVFRRTVPIGVEHGTVGVLADDGTLYEVTTFRKDIDTDGRRAVVEFADRLEEDLARRDFTINAVAWHPLRDEWADPYGGRDDLERARLRTVGDAAERFREDLLRVLRALRFAGRFELTIETETWNALCAAVDELDVLSPERVREELTKVLEAERPSGALALYAASGVLAKLYPELIPRDSTGWDVVGRTFLVIDHVSGRAPRSRLATLLEPAMKRESLTAVAAVMKRLRSSNADTAAVVSVVRALHMDAPQDAGEAARRWLAVVGRDTLPGVARVWCGAARLEHERWPGPGVTEVRRRVASRVRDLRSVARSGVPLVTRELAIDGNDLKEMGLPPGPEFGEILDGLLDRVLGDPELNEPEILRGLVAAVIAEEGG